jgi:hypothetical protein
VSATEFGYYASDIAPAVQFLFSNVWSNQVWARVSSLISKLLKEENVDNFSTALKDAGSSFLNNQR